MDDNTVTDEIQQGALNIENLIQFTPGLLYWKDINGVYQGCNDEFVKLAGLASRSDAKGKTDYELPWKNRAISYTSIDQKVMMTAKPDLNREEVVTLSDGRTIVMITNKVPIFNKNKQVIGLLGITVDITHQKKIEDDLKIAVQNLEVANKAKTEFLENMRHDIRTPLSGIMGFAELIQCEATDPTIKEYADSLVVSSQSLLDLLNGILEALNVFSGDVPLLKKKFSLHGKLKDIVLLNQTKADQKKLTLLFEHDETIPDYLLGDSVRIHRVVLELITNALNFTHQGEVKLSTHLAKENDNEVIIKIVVADTGIGIPVEHQENIYLQFKRLTPSYKGIYKGFGLGLSIVKQFVEELSGELCVDSKVDAGSVFTCVLRLKKPLLEDASGCETARNDSSS